MLIHHPLVRWLLALFAALLPVSERAPLEARTHLPLKPASVLLGLLQFIGGFLLWFGAYLRFATALAQGQVVTAVDGGVEPSKIMSVLTLAGPLTMLAFLVTPVGLGLGYVAVAGAVRLVAIAAADEVPGDPLVTLAAWLWRGGRRGASRARFKVELGPERPDRLAWNGRGELVVLSSRDKPGWNGDVTIALGPELFRLDRVEQRDDGRWISLAFVLRPLHPSAIARGIVVYRDEPPPARLASAEMNRPQ